MSFAVSGKGSVQLFEHEPGGHRWQRIPPTENKGRVHSSTVTVAVLPIIENIAGLNMRDVDIVATRGTGPGGQHRNTTDSCIVATHRPTGITARADMRSQTQSRKNALEVLAARVRHVQAQQVKSAHGAVRKEQVGSGERGDKVRTYRDRDNQVLDHRSGHKWRLTDWMAGKW